MEITGKIENLEPNPLGMRIANALRKLKEPTPKGTTAWMSKGGEPLKTTQDNPLGELFIGDADKEAENLAYGDMPMRMPEMSKIPVMKTGRKKGVADLMLLGMDAAPVANIAHKAAGRAVSKGLEQVAAKVPQGIKQGAREIQQAVVGSGPVAEIIKGKGGNWAPGHIEFITDYLRSKRPKMDDPTQDAALDNWITGTMGKYLKNDWGTKDDPVKAASLGRPNVPYNPNRGHMTYDQFDKYTQGGGWGGADPSDETDAVYIASKENRQQASDIATLDDAQKKGLGILENTFDNPEKIGDATDPYGNHDFTGGILFENITDAVVRPESARNYVATSKDAGVELPEWMEKLPSERAIHTLPVDGDPYMRREFKERIDDLGFPRMVELIAEELRAGKIPLNNQGRIQVGIPDAAQRLVKSAIDEPKTISAQSTKDLPAFKGLEYDDGSKWVEIPPNHNQLRAEGDLMGHCVGNYCAMIERGEKRILSLRDAQGMPNVTIDAEGNLYRYRRPQGADPEGMGNISQAMGRGNSFPDKYLAKVQDFLRKTNPDSINLIEPVGLPEPDFVNDRFANMSRQDPIAYAYGLRDKSKVADALDPLNDNLPEGVAQELENLRTVDKEGRWITDEDLNRLADKVPKTEYKFNPDEIMNVADGLRYMDFLDPDERRFVRTLDRRDIIQALHRQGDNWNQLLLDIREGGHDREAAHRVMRALRGERNVYDAPVQAAPVAPQAVNFGRPLTQQMWEFEDLTGHRIADAVFANNELMADAERLITMLEEQLNNGNQRLVDRIINAMRIRGLIDEGGPRLLPDGPAAAPGDLVNDIPPDGDNLL
jgi:hypothetical protein